MLDGFTCLVYPYNILIPILQIIEAAWGRPTKSIVPLGLSSEQSENESKRANVEAKTSSSLWRCEVGRCKTVSEPNELVKVASQN